MRRQEFSLASQYYLVRFIGRTMLGIQYSAVHCDLILIPPYIIHEDFSEIPHEVGLKREL